MAENFLKQYYNPTVAPKNNIFNNYNGANHGNLPVENYFKNLCKLKLIKIMFLLK
jgi:hypothetical protein